MYSERANALNLIFKEYRFSTLVSKKNNKMNPTVKNHPTYTIEKYLLSALVYVDNGLGLTIQ